MEAFEILMLGLCQCQSLQRLQLVVGTETKGSGGASSHACITF